MKTLIPYFLALLLLGLSACSDGSEAPDPAPESGKVPHYVNLTLQVAGQRGTRGDMTDDEDKGYGEEAAAERASRVSSVTVFLYDAASDINDDAKAAATTVHAFHWNVSPKTEGSVTSYTTGSRLLSDKVEYGTYKLLVVANKNLSELNGKTLKELRDYIYNGQPYQLGSTNPKYPNDPITVGNFIMSSISEVELDYNPSTTSAETNRKGSYANPFIPNSDVTIERLAARIDLAFDPTTYVDAEKDATGNILKKHGYEYPVYDGSNVKVGTFRLTNAMPFNLTQQQYVFKHTTVGQDLKQVKVPGREVQYYDMNAGTRPLAYNFVIDPHTLDQIIGRDLVGPYYIPFFYHENIGENEMELLKRFPVPMKTNSRLNDWTFDSKSYRYYILGYSAENTATIEQQKSTNPPPKAMMAGIRFLGIYHLDADPNNDREVSFDYVIHHAQNYGNVHDVDLPMTYGIVRNNIYRIYIKKVNRLKDDFHIQLSVSVLPWQYYKHEDIYM